VVIDPDHADRATSALGALNDVHLAVISQPKGSRSATPPPGA
jgi:hypothetical protein